MNDLILIALLRGINVAGHKLLKMDKLRACFQKLGFTGIQTYLQSGNVIFKATAGSVAFIGHRIEAQILGDFGWSVSVLLRTGDEMSSLVRDNPRLNNSEIDPSKLHVTFLAATAPPSSAQSLESLAVKPERFQMRPREIYLYCPNGYGKTKLSNQAIERKLGIGATTRNWRTVLALLSMSQPEAAP